MKKCRRLHRSPCLETVYYVSSLPMVPENALALLLLIRSYWGIESGHHYRLDVTAREDASRVRHRNSLLVLGQVRRIALGFYYAWRAARKNKRQSTLKDFHDTMNRHQQRAASRHCHPIIARAKIRRGVRGCSSPSCRLVLLCHLPREKQPAWSVTQ